MGWTPLAEIAGFPNPVLALSLKEHWKEFFVGFPDATFEVTSYDALSERVWVVHWVSHATNSGTLGAFRRQDPVSRWRDANSLNCAGTRSPATPALGPHRSFHLGSPGTSRYSARASGVSPRAAAMASWRVAKMLVSPMTAVTP